LQAARQRRGLDEVICGRTIDATMHRMIRLTGIVLCLLVLASPVTAHPVPFSYVDVRLAPTGADVDVTVHVFDAAHDLEIAAPERLLDRSTATAYGDRLKALLAGRLRMSLDGQTVQGDWSGPQIITEQSSLRFHIRYSAPGLPGRVSVAARLFPYDDSHQTFVNIYEQDRLRSQVIVDAGRPDLEYFTGGRQGAFALMRKFVPAGVHHILIGPDHVLFLIGLLLLGGSVRRLLVVVTSFTLAHSITLSVAALNIFTPPARLIEPAIALSIVYVGADNLLVRGGRDVRALIALAFGFIHGFGFAYVLREMRLPGPALGWSLFSFNLGVEIGQLLVVVTVATSLAALRSRSEAAGRVLALAGSLAVIAAGTFWFVQRVFFAGGA
jgi:hydrogenase/urease accessory protein HupE